MNLLRSQQLINGKPAIILMLISRQVIEINIQLQFITQHHVMSAKFLTGKVIRGYKC